MIGCILLRDRREVKLSAYWRFLVSSNPETGSKILLFESENNCVLMTILARWRQDKTGARRVCFSVSPRTFWQQSTSALECDVTSATVLNGWPGRKLRSARVDGTSCALHRLSKAISCAIIAKQRTRQKASSGPEVDESRLPALPFLSKLQKHDLFLLYLLFFTRFWVLLSVRSNKLKVSG